MLRLQRLRLWWPVLCWCWHGSSLGWWKSSPWANELPHTMWGRSMDKLSSILHHWGDTPVVITHLNNQLGSHAENRKWSGFPVGALTRTMTWIYAKFTLSQRGPSVSGALKLLAPGSQESRGHRAGRPIGLYLSRSLCNAWLCFTNLIWVKLWAGFR